MGKSFQTLDIRRQTSDVEEERPRDKDKDIFQEKCWLHEKMECAWHMETKKDRKRLFFLGQIYVLRSGMAKQKFV